MTFIDRIRSLGSGKLGRVAGIFASRSFHSFSSLVFSLVAGRLLTIEDHGLYGQSLARIVVVQAIVEAGLQYSLIRFLSVAVERGQEEVNQVIQASLRLKLYATAGVAVLTGIWALAGFFFPFSGALSLQPPPDHLTQLTYVLLGGIGMSIFSYLDAVLVSYQNYRLLSLWIPLTGSVRLAFLAFFYFYSDGPLTIDETMFSFIAGPYIAAAVFFAIFPSGSFFKRLKTQQEKKTGKEWVHRLISYNIWIIAAAFLSILSDWMEVLLIGNAADTALFNAARMPLQGFLILLATMQSLLLPAFSKLNTADQFLQYFKKLYKLILPALILLLPGFWIFQWFIPAWYGESYFQSVDLFWIMYPGFMLRIVFAPLGTALFALDKPVLITAEAGLRMIAGLSLNLILIPLYGVNGAAVSNLIGQFAGWIFLIYCYLVFFHRGKFPEFRKHAD